GGRHPFHTGPGGPGPAGGLPPRPPAPGRDTDGRGRAVSVEVPGVLVEAPPDVARTPALAILVAVGREDRGVPAVLDDAHPGHPRQHLRLVVAVDVDVDVLRGVVVDHQLARSPGRFLVLPDGLGVRGARLA